MHLQRGHAHEETWAAEFFFLLVVAEHMANVLAQEAFNTFAEFLYTIDIRLIHLPFHAFPRLEGWNLLVYFVIPGNVRHQVLDHRESFHGKDGDGLVLRKSIHASLAGEAGGGIHLPRAGAALPCFAVPAHSKIGSLMFLDIMQRIEHHHSSGDGHSVFCRLSSLTRAAEDSKDRISHG